MIGLQLDRAPARGDRLVDAAGEPRHFAKIAVVERNAIIGGDRLLQQFDPC